MLPSGSLVKHKLVRAAKEHVCVTCGEVILPKTHYVYTELFKRPYNMYKLNIPDVEKRHLSCFEMSEQGVG